MKILVDCIRYCHQMKVVHRDIKVMPAYAALKLTFDCEFALGYPQTGRFRYK